MKKISKKHTFKNEMIYEKIKRIEESIILIFFMGLMVSGAFSNISVVIKNDGKMPVYAEKGTAFKSEFHTDFQNFDEVELPYYADIIKIGKAYFSIGDFMIFFGIMGVVGTIAYRATREIKKIIIRRKK